MSLTRQRCTRCGKLVEESALVEHPMARHYKAMLAPQQLMIGEDTLTFDTAHVEAKLAERYHGRWSRRGMDTCGPVEPEHVSDYQECFEAFVGEKL